MLNTLCSEAKKRMEPLTTAFEEHFDELVVSGNYTEDVVKGKKG